MAPRPRDARAPPRIDLSPEVVEAARVIHRAVWGCPYPDNGESPMRHAGGSYWHRELLRRANEWERMAVAARICAWALPDHDDYYEPADTRICGGCGNPTTVWAVRQAEDLHPITHEIQHVFRCPSCVEWEQAMAKAEAGS